VGVCAIQICHGAKVMTLTSFPLHVRLFRPFYTGALRQQCSEEPGKIAFQNAHGTLSPRGRVVLSSTPKSDPAALTCQISTSSTLDCFTVCFVFFCVLMFFSVGLVISCLLVLFCIVGMDLVA